MSLSTDLAQSQQEANELWGKTSPSSPASKTIGNSGDEPMVAAGDVLLPGLSPAANLIQRILEAEAARLLREADGDPAKATPWRNPDLPNSGADDLETRTTPCGAAALMEQVEEPAPLRLQGFAPFRFRSLLWGRREPAGSLALGAGLLVVALALAAATASIASHLRFHSGFLLPIGGYGLCPLYHGCQTRSFYIIHNPASRRSDIDDVTENPHG